MKRQAIKIVLSDKAREQQLVVVDEFQLADAKTKQLVQALNALGVDSSALLVGADMDEAVVRAARNIPRVRTLPVELLNVVDVLNSKRVVMSVDAVRKAEEIWGGDLVRIKREAAMVLADEGEEG